MRRRTGGEIHTDKSQRTYTNASGGMEKKKGDSELDLEQESRCVNSTQH